MPPFETHRHVWKVLCRGRQGRGLAALTSLLALCAPFARAAEIIDVVVYGGTSAGVAAAVQAKRMGRSVVVVGPDRHLGGLTAGGLGFTDSGRKEVIGGLAREFYERVFAHYEKPGAWNWQDRAGYGNRGQGTPAIDGGARAMWVFEPQVAEAIFEDLVRQHGITVHRDEWLDRDHGVTRRDGRIAAIRMQSGKEFRGRMFVDATYEGDLMAAAGVSFTVGREANVTYGETLNGVQVAVATKHQFTRAVDAFVEPGNPASGLLPHVQPGLPGLNGTGDKRVQAYCYRVCMTDHPENRVPFPKPDGYEARQYELLLRYLLAGWRDLTKKFDPLPNRKTDTNNSGAFSFDNIGMNYDYPEASYQRRREILREHETYQKGLLWFLCHDPRVPAEVRTEIGRWGLARDEFKDNGHWPHQIYVREARRMVSDFVITERHLKLEQPTLRPVGMGSYNMDSHHVQRYADAAGHARNEGDVQVGLKASYPIDFGTIVPKRAECANLAVPVCVSASHIAYGSIRMEPVFMVLGQAAATAACLALDADQALQDVDYAKLRQRLLADRQVLAAP